MIPVSQKPANLLLPDRPPGCPPSLPLYAFDGSGFLYACQQTDVAILARDSLGLGYDPTTGRLLQIGPAASIDRHQTAVTSPSTTERSPSAPLTMARIDASDPASRLAAANRAILAGHIAPLLESIQHP